MPVLIAAALILTVLAASDRFSDFDAAKCLALGVLLPVAALAAWPRIARRRSGAPGLGWAALALTPALAVLAAVATAGQDVPFGECARALTIATAGVALFVLAGHVDPAAQSTRVLVLAGAAAPLLLAVSQALLAAGWNPLGVPFRPGTFSATLGNRGLVGELGVLALPFAAMIPALRPRRRHDRLLQAVVVLAAAAVIAVSGARAAWLGGLVFGAVHLALRPRPAARETGDLRRASDGPTSEDAVTDEDDAAVLVPRPRALLLGLGIVAFAGAAALLFGSHAPVERLRSMIDADHPSNRVRLGLWQDALELAAAHPVAGVGLGRFGAAHASVRSAEEWAISGLTSHATTPHSEPLRILAETGWVGFLAIAGLVVALLVTLARRARGGRNPDATRALAALAGAAAALTVSCFWFTFAHPAGVLFVAVAAGLGVARSEAMPAATKDRLLGAGGIAAALLASFGLIALAERDSAAVSLRDRAEEQKARVHAAAAGTGAVPLTEIERLGATARAIPGVTASPWLTPSLRHRLLLTSSNLADERRRLRTSAEAATGDATLRLRRAADALPDDRSVLEALEDAAARAPWHMATQRLLASFEADVGRKLEATSRRRALLAANPDVPLLRTDLALVLVDARVYERAAALLQEELDRYPEAPESAAAWELRARAIGALGRIAEATAVAERWVRVQGASLTAEALLGELALRFGQSDDTLGRTRPADEPPALELLIAIDRARHREPGAAATALLALLGRHPDQPAVLEALQEALHRSAEAAEGPARAGIEALRSRALARLKTAYAWQHLADGDTRMLRISARAALRLEPRLWDARLLEALAAVRDGDEAALQEALDALHAEGFEGFERLDAFPELGLDDGSAPLAPGD